MSDYYDGVESNQGFPDFSETQIMSEAEHVADPGQVGGIQSFNDTHLYGDPHKKEQAPHHLEGDPALKGTPFEGAKLDEDPEPKGSHPNLG